MGDGVVVQYQNVFGPLIKLEADYDKVRKRKAFSLSVGGVWGEPGGWQSHAIVKGQCEGSGKGREEVE